MRVLLAEDDRVSRRRLEVTLVGWGYEVVLAQDGDEAWRVLTSDDPPPLAILDWMMPGRPGPELCRALRELPSRPPVYLILLTARSAREDVVAGLEAGADDYVKKPYDRAEISARLAVGVRVISLQRELAQRVGQLEQALSEVEQLSGLLPICAYCSRVRDDRDYWEKLEHYVARHSRAQFSHGICPDCYEKTWRPELERRQRERGEGGT